MCVRQDKTFAKGVKLSDAAQLARNQTNEDDVPGSLSIRFACQVVKSSPIGRRKSSDLVSNDESETTTPAWLMYHHRLL